jgi:DNA adenine methylase
MAEPQHAEFHLKPILKWAGGKRKLLPAIRPLIPASYGRYVEPFFGGGAVLFDQRPPKALVNDLNSELIAMYTTIRDSVENLIEILDGMADTPESFYEIRSWDRDSEIFAQKSAVERAARTIFLNRTGYNGLYRVNSQNQCNVPYGRYKRKFAPDCQLLREVSRYFKTCEIEFRSLDFRPVIASTGRNDFIYVDPPYAPLDKALSSFTAYTSIGFTVDDLVALKDLLDEASERGANWVLSNVLSDVTKEIFPEAHYQIQIVEVKRPINSKGTGRGPVREILVSPKCH